MDLCYSSSHTSPPLFPSLEGGKRRIIPWWSVPNAEKTAFQRRDLSVYRETCNLGQEKPTLPRHEPVPNTLWSGEASLRNKQRMTGAYQEEIRIAYLNSRPSMGRSESLLHQASGSSSTRIWNGRIRTRGNLVLGRKERFDRLRA